MLEMIHGITILTTEVTTVALAYGGYSGIVKHRTLAFGGPRPAPFVRRISGQSAVRVGSLYLSLVPVLLLLVGWIGWR